MAPKLSKTVIAAATAALVTLPAWAAGDAPDQVPGAPAYSTEMPADPSQAPEAGVPQPWEGAAQPADEVEQSAQQPAMGDNPLYAHTPEELHRMNVVDQEGKKVGRVESVVLGPDGGSAHVVISSGGFLGIGSKEIVVSIDELHLGEDRLHVAASADQLEARAGEVPEGYVALQPERPIGEFSAFEPIQEAPATEGLPAVPLDTPQPAVPQ
ncbi:MAG: PRC-barrel domain-containing protein [Rhodocyclaceae bacterium]